MTGFIRGLFRSKPKAEAPEPAETEAPQPQAKPGAYYLPPDEAKTFGNLEYMRSSKSIRRTFPKQKIGEDNEMIRSISAMEMQKAGRNGSAAPMPPKANPTTNGSTNGSMTNGSTTNGSMTGSTNGATPRAAEPQANSTSADSANANSTNTARRQADSSMDMFRNMARDLKKR